MIDDYEERTPIEVNNYKMETKNIDLTESKYNLFKLKKISHLIMKVIDTK